MKKILAVLGAVLLIAAPAFRMARAEEMPAVRMDQEELLLTIGKQKKLKLEYDVNIRKGKDTEEWLSEDAAVAEVDEKGRVTAAGAGSTQILCTATLKDGRVYEVVCSVTVYIPVASLETEERTLTVTPAKPVQAPVTILPEDATFRELEWVSDNEEVARVDAAGMITAGKSGRARIEAKTTDGTNRRLSWEVIVPTVYAEETEFELQAPGAIQIPVHYAGGSFEEDYQVVPSGSEIRTEAEIQEELAVITVTPVSAGEAQLTVSNRRNPTDQAVLRLKISDDAIPNPGKLPVDQLEIIGGVQILAYRFQVTNHSSEEIGEIGFVVDYRDQFGDTHYLFSNTDGTIQNAQYTTMINILPGESASVVGKNELFRANDLIREVRLAICYYRYLNGEKVYIPDSQLYWYSSKTGEAERPEIAGIYRQPEEEVLDRALRIDIGAVTCDLYSYVVKPFSRSYHAGIYLANVPEGGYAEVWGLKAGDVIYGSDGRLWVDDPFLLNRIIAQVYDGETVNIQYVRNGEEHETEIKRDPDR